MTSQLQQPMNRVQKRYTSIALIATAVFGAPLILMGYPALGKGLIAGTLFSVLNFWLMAKALPGRLGHGRARTIVKSLASIYGRFALMALPLIIAAKYPQLAVSSVAVGLFAIPLVILSEHLWRQWIGSQEVGF